MPRHPRRAKAKATAIPFPRARRLIILNVNKIARTQLEISFSPRAVHTHSLSTRGDVYYPSTRSEREAFRTAAGKRVPPHHSALYDLVRTIPAVRVSTYKDVCAAVGQGSPRSVGGALRNNPFAPRIPCHRVIASSFSWADSRASGRRRRR
jgi:O-6-methylguanine DNA methyltransferase